MSVLTHLQDTAEAVKIQEWERILIDTSISTLSLKLNRHFNNIESSFVFGSYDRKTILKRSKDPDSDVDYMVVFNDGSSYKPQTLMTRLKTFAEANYLKNEIYQSSPTVVLELGHIRFELAPAYKSWGTTYIPAPSSNFIDWISTDPSSVKEDLNAKNRNCDYQIRKLVRILKYWNTINGKVYTSYELEKYIIDKFYFFCTSLKDYFYSSVESLPTFWLPTYKENKVLTFKNIISRTKEYESESMPETAANELKKAIP